MFKHDSVVQVVHNYCRSNRATDMVASEPMNREISLEEKLGGMDEKISYQNKRKDEVANDNHHESITFPHLVTAEVNYDNFRVRPQSQNIPNLLLVWEHVRVGLEACHLT
ncbi:hypothetical protein V6N11_019114 [Hibiscus sabdariffa]|uniref:Uncharacterized protein n=1 Tax=Hibiscus sabdariffa TaxID=183260 RepID=A0ABR2R1G6_9ROSI